ncbi:hypothetical protein LOK49_LG05G00851 [Camellia lanceoleosa]|uniref:Uncharacterized protein n=1 Tax=Camellia lanceoleosa TaxID=1840588 RepID=A0ACC0HIT8_9ERIC|nr:hypothetical protein LOK49_LG05G00851 [Camellia lanceoleosa]
MMVTRRNRRPTPNRKTQANGPQPTSNRFAGLGFLEPKSNTPAQVNGASTSNMDLTPPGPHPSITQQKLIANSLVPSLCSDPVHSQAISSPHLSPETHTTTSVVPDDLDTTVNTHIENSPTLLPEKPTMQVQLSVSPEIPMEELKADPSPASSLNLLTTPHPSSLRLEKAKARKPPDPPRSYGERGNHTK